MALTFEPLQSELHEILSTYTTMSDQEIGQFSTYLQFSLTALADDPQPPRTRMSLLFSDCGYSNLRAVIVSWEGPDLEDPNVIIMSDSMPTEAGALRSLRKHVVIQAANRVGNGDLAARQRRAEVAGRLAHVEMRGIKESAAERKA